MELRLGDLLVEGGVLNEEQVEVILRDQESGGEPFGVLAERLFGVDPAAIETAWARQYAQITRIIDPREETFDEEALQLISRRQAWQFRVLPIRFDPHELMMATTVTHLPRALRFAAHIIGFPIFFVIAEEEALGEALCFHYPLSGLTPKSVSGGGLDRLINLARCA